MSTNLGASVLKKLTTARLYWQQSGQTGWTDFGNVVDYKDDPKIDRVEHMQAQKGFHRLDFSLAKQVATKKTVTLDEHFKDTILLMLLSNQYPIFTQEPVTSDSSGITSDNTSVTADGGTLEEVSVALDPLVAGATYNLGKLGVTIVSAVDGNDVALNPVTDYALDGGSGMLTVLQAAPVGPWTIEFTCPVLDELVFEAFGNLLALGNFKLIEFDQFSPVPRNVETFAGQVYVTGWGENKTDGFTEFTVEVLHQNSVRLMRAD